MMPFHDRNKRIVLSAPLIDGVYKIDHVASSSERALCCEVFTSTSKNLMPMSIDHIPQKKFDQIIDDGRSIYFRGEILEKRRIKRYWLYHHRCRHVGPRVFSPFHTHKDIDSPIKVPPNLELCDVCLTAKMKKIRDETLATHNNEKLALFSVDIAELFPEFLDGN